MTGEEARKYLEMLEAAEEAVLLVDRDLRILFQNRLARVWQQRVGVPDDVIGKGLFEVYGFLPERVREEYREVFARGRILVTTETSAVAGREVATEPRKNPLFEGAQVAKVLTCVRDLSHRATAEARLRESEEKYRALVESTDDSIYLLDRDCRYLFMNRKHMARMGFSGEEFLGRAYAEFHSPEETEWLRERVAHVIETGASLREEHWSRRDGHYFLLTLSPIREGDGRISAVTVVSKDVTPLKKLEEELRSLALTDPLTGLYNRRGFFTLAEFQLRLADRRRQGVYMLYADLDGLKQINDTRGHQEGDRALVEVSRLLKTTYRASDVVSRISGDEFAVIPVGTSKDDVDVIIRRFQANLDAFNAQGRLGYEISVSLGVVLYDPEEPRPLEDLLSLADRMMYERKRERHRAG